MALTQKRREELAAEIDVFASWLSHSERQARIRAVAAELRGEDVDDSETQKQVEERLAEANAAEAEAQEVKSRKRS